MPKNPLLFAPAVFVTGENYNIYARVRIACAFAVDVDGKKYYDHSNGVKRTSTSIHCVTVPREALDNAKKYTVVIEPLIIRLAYRSQFAHEQRYDFDFRPVPSEDINIYHIADTHGRALHAIRSASSFGKRIDLLILNGDIVNSSERVSDFDTIYRLADGITHGNCPVICSRGNHDLRGRAAEKMWEYMPSVNGKTYFSLRTGNIWALVLDCAEDKDDSHEEYGGANCCHEFRVEQTEYIKKVIANAANEYEADGVRHKFVIVHNPFTHLDHAPFDIERDIYNEWTALLREHIKPELIFAGHYHNCFVSKPGDDFDSNGQPCPVIVGSKPEGRDAFTGCGVSLKDKEPEIGFYRG
ncbi:MAG: metallophosphoesterase [Clostridia bacterium]|nr:metallophosphoesterase [Clostridia bacterium]